MIQNARFGLVMLVGAAIAAGMRELYSDEQTCVRPGRPAMFFDQGIPESCQPFARVRCDYELPGVGASLVRYRNRFASPNELCSALTEFPPPLGGELARISVRSAVPTFHGMNGDPVANGDSATGDRLPQR